MRLKRKHGFVLCHTGGATGPSIVFRTELPQRPTDQEYKEEQVKCAHCGAPVQVSVEQYEGPRKRRRLRYAIAIAVLVPALLSGALLPFKWALLTAVVGVMTALILFWRAQADCGVKVLKDYAPKGGHEARSVH